MKRLVVAAAARADLAAIARHTEERWGAAQKARYLGLLHNGFSELARNPELGAARGDIKPALRGLPVGRHVVFYRTTGDSVEILRVLHGAMDVRRHLIKGT